MPPPVDVAVVHGLVTEDARGAGDVERGIAAGVRSGHRGAGEARAAVAVPPRVPVGGCLPAVLDAAYLGVLDGQEEEGDAVRPAFPREMRALRYWISASANAVSERVEGVAILSSIEAPRVLLINFQPHCTVVKKAR